MSYSEIRALPVRYRMWFLDRLSTEFKTQAESRKKARNNSTADRRSVVQELPMGEMNPSARQNPEKKFK